MSFSRTMLCALAVVLSALACTDSQLTGPARVPSAGGRLAPDGSPGSDGSSGSAGLDLRVPRLTQSDLEQRDFVELLPDGDPVARVIDPDDYEYSSRPLQQIFDARTRVYFQPGYAAALGIHSYIGNVGTIATTAHVTYLDQDLGSHTAHREQYTPFVLDLGMTKTVFAEARVFTDYTCGLQVQGNSNHRAHWQFFTGTAVPLWGSSRRTSQASPASNGSCTDRRTGQRGGTETRAGGIVCRYLITYDLDTGEILAADLLDCSSTGGTQI